MGNILDRIVASKKDHVARSRAAVSLDALKQSAPSADPPRDFAGAIVAPSPHGIHLIAEIKRRSPSAGLIRADFDPAQLAAAYEQAGASAISVLTDPDYFDGDIRHIRAVRAAASLPVLRKDFVIDEYQIWEARAAEADAVLLIAEVLGVETVVRFAELIGALGMTALIEAYQPDLMNGVLEAIADPIPGHVLIGINNRDLTRQVTDLSTTRRLAGLLTDTTRLVSESGIATRADVLAVQQAGAQAILVGEAILSAGDVTTRIRELLATD